jgi:hypothetical protein
MSHRPFLRAALFAVLSTTMTAAPGCASWLAKGETVVGYRRGDTPELQEAPSDGEYALHNMYGNATALRTRPLRKGDTVGFRKEKPQEVVAVAGDWEYVLTDGNYVWKRR